MYRKYSIIFIALALVLLLVLSSGMGTAGVFDKQADSNRSFINDKPNYVEGELLVRFRPGAAGKMNVVAQVHEQVGGTVVKEFANLPGLQLVKVDKGITVSGAIEKYSKNPNILYAEPNYLYYRAGEPIIPNDEFFDNLWGLYNIGQSGGTPGADISAPEAWNITTGSEEVIVAVIDTGVDYNHPDLIGNMIPGKNFTSSNPNDYMDRNGHGTHVAGTIAAVGNNGIGVTGVMWTAKIMPVKTLGDNGSGSLDNALDGILYANANGAHIINCSWGGGGYSEALKDAIAASTAVVVCAAGNDTKNNDTNPSYPANYNCPNIISVAASNRNDNLASFSNYGVNSVHLAAPGVDIYSTLPGSTAYDFLSGTSMAAPHVAGVAGLLKAVKPELTSQEIKEIILNSVDKKHSLENKVITGGRVNALKALQTATYVPVTGLTLSAETVDLAVYEVIYLTATVLPENATNKKVFWFSSDEDTVTVDDYGKVTALRDGTAIVTAETEDGGYTAGCIITVVPQPQPVIIYGDVSGDGIVDVGDAALIFRYIADPQALSEAQLLAADVNGDGVVNNDDAILILRYIVGLISELPVLSP